MAATDTHTNEMNKQAVKDFMEVFSSGDVDGTMDLMAPEATWWVAGTIPGISGIYTKEEFRELLGGIASGCEGGAIQLTPKAFTAEGTRVAVETESFAEVSENGRVYKNEYHFLFTVNDDGLITSVKEYLDTMHTKAVFVD